MREINTIHIVHKEKQMIIHEKYYVMHWEMEKS